MAEMQSERQRIASDCDYPANRHSAGRVSADDRIEMAGPEQSPERVPSEMRHPSGGNEWTNADWRWQQRCSCEEGHVQTFKKNNTGVG
ncbi:hypothetical protein ZHAS_00017473 [Anopheles sinensis]|uniref:Uncharacterized protein n=1 Tax=Anopheles sinensis TaxID=74873 RepID=A0A084WGN1_ANOSI|nr:hypothetical protein ZHAS_00017473 [Anopheles sinensis]